MVMAMASVRVMGLLWLGLGLGLVLGLWLGLVMAR